MSWHRIEQLSQGFDEAIRRLRQSGTHIEAHNGQMYAFIGKKHRSLLTKPGKSNKDVRFVPVSAPRYDVARRNEVVVETHPCNICKVRLTFEELAKHHEVHAKEIGKKEIDMVTIVSKNGTIPAEIQGRARDILHLLHEGKTQKEVARAVGIAEPTLSLMLKKLRSRFGDVVVPSRSKFRGVYNNRRGRVANPSIAERDRKIIDMFLSGKSETEIAKELSITPKVANNVVHRTRKKAGVHSIPLYLDIRKNGARVQAQQQQPSVIVKAVVTEKPTLEQLLKKQEDLALELASLSEDIKAMVNEQVGQYKERLAKIRRAVDN